LVDQAVSRQYNETARKYGAEQRIFSRAPKQTSRFQLKSAEQILNSTPIKWRIKGVIPENGIAAIYGPSGSGKSFLVMDMATSIARGSNWFGYRVKPCSVVYVCLEGEAGLSVRLAAYRTTGTIPSAIDFIDQPLNLLNPKDLKDLGMSIKARGSTDGVVIIDTLNRAAPGMDENSSVDMGHAIHAAKVIQQGLGGLVLLVHHSGKDTAKGMRGHSSLYAALDAAIEVKRSGPDRAWSLAKAKDGEDGRAHAFMLDVINLGSDEDGDPITSCVVRRVIGPSSISKPLTHSQRIGMDAFMAAASANAGKGDARVYAGVDQWRREFYSRSTGDNPDSKRRAFNRVREQLVAIGKLVVDDGVYRLPLGFPDLSD
ncbi:MAG TPA: hypothetical protein DIU11_13240, partial [Pusillimonas sp.]|nr:hypothetical protein [Pusillimonas sp.]